MITVADTLEAKIGRACANDVVMLTESCEQINKGIGYKLRLTLLATCEFKASAVQAVLDTVQVQPSNILFIYYTGHGYVIGINSVDAFPIDRRDWIPLGSTGK